MKRSNIWFASILIASVLLLSGASSYPQPSNAPPRPNLATTPSRSGIETEQPELNQQKGKPETCESSNPSPSQHLIGAETGGHTSANQRNCDIEQKGKAALAAWWAFVAGWNWIVIFTGALAVVTVIQARLLYKQLHGDRPFLVADAFDLRNFSPIESKQRHPLLASVVFRNYGKGPAFISDVRLTVTVAKSLPPWRDYGLCERWDIRGDVVGPNQTTEQMSALLMRPNGIPPNEQSPVLSPQEFPDIEQGNAILVFYGIVKYRSALKKRYKTAFFWVCEPPTPRTLRTQAIFIPGPNSRNYRT